MNENTDAEVRLEALWTQSHFIKVEKMNSHRGILSKIRCHNLNDDHDGKVMVNVMLCATEQTLTATAWTHFWLAFDIVSKERSNEALPSKSTQPCPC